MFRTATAAGPRPAALDLPPHLQPMAITSAAPRTDHRKALLGAFAIYGCMPLGLLAMERMMPKPLATPSTQTVTWGPIEVPSPTSSSPAGPRVSAPPAPSAPPAAMKDAAPLAPAPTQASPDDVAQVPTTLPQGGGDTREASPGVPGGTGTTPQPPGTGPGTGVDPRASGSGGVLNFESSGLQILRQVDPVYPAVARAAHVQGNVVLRMLVDEQGAPIQVDVVEGPALLRAEAVRAATQWRFVAARLGDQRMKATFLLTLKFRLS